MNSSFCFLFCDESEPRMFFVQKQIEHIAHNFFIKVFVFEKIELKGMNYMRAHLANFKPDACASHEFQVGCARSVNKFLTLISLKTKHRMKKFI